MQLQRIEDTQNNPNTRIPICLCLDTSSSMSEVTDGEYTPTGETVVQDGKRYNIVTGGKTKIDELNSGIKMFYDAISEDEIALYSAEICIVTFNDTANCIVDYNTIDKHGDAPALRASGMTAMGEGVNLALDLLDRRKNELKDAGVDYFQPWLVLMTDGMPNGDPEELTRAISRTVELINSRRLVIFPVGIGEDADMNTLRRFSPVLQPLRLRGLKFKEFFTWLSKSVSKVSQSLPGDVVHVEHTGDWSDQGIQPPQKD